MLISPVLLRSGSYRFRSSITSRAPTIDYAAPVNSFGVDLHSGRFILRQTDLFVQDIPPLAITRIYQVWGKASMAFGVGSNNPYDICPTGSRFPYTFINLNLEDGSAIYFPRVSPGTGYADAVYVYKGADTEFDQARISWNGHGWILALPDNHKLIFPESYHAQSCAEGAVVELLDAAFHRVSLIRDASGKLAKLTFSSGRSINFEYDDKNRIIQEVDSSGALRNYTYDSSGHLKSVGDSSHILWQFEYEHVSLPLGYDPYILTIVKDGDSRTLLTNTYRNGARITEQKLANGEIFKYEYLFSKEKRVTETIVSMPNGDKKKFDF